MKATHTIGKEKEPVAVIKLQFQVDINLIRKAIINLLWNGKSAAKKDIVAEVKRITLEYGRYGYSDMINADDLEDYDYYLSIAEKKIVKLFPSFIKKE